MRLLLTVAAIAALAAPALARAHHAPSQAMNDASSATVPSCAPGNPAVWVNLSSHIYFSRGDRYFGKTKRGKYLCKSAADAEGDRAPHASAAGRATTGDAGAANPQSYGATATAVPTYGSKPSGMRHHRRHGHGTASPAPDAPSADAT